MTTKVSVVNEHSTSFMGGISDISPLLNYLLSSALEYQQCRVRHEMMIRSSARGEGADGARIAHLLQGLLFVMEAGVV
jgi:hypothetical protein